MKKIILLTSLLVAGMTVSSCTSDDKELYGSKHDVKKIEALICDFEEDTEGASTRTSYTYGSSGYEAVWTDGDTLGIYPLEGDQVSFPISDGVGSKTTVFDGGAWALRGTFWYAAYYPFSTVNYTIPETAIPVSYIGQVQKGNNTTAHLSDYDFMAAAATKPSSNGSVTLPFKHLGAFISMSLTLPKAGTYTALTLTSDKGEFITEGTVDLSATEPAISAVSKSTSVTLNLDSVSLDSDDLVLKVNMMIAPTDLTGSTIEIKVTDSEGASYINEDKEWKRSAAFAPNTTIKVSRTLSKSDTGGGEEGSGEGDNKPESSETPYLTFSANTPQTVKIGREVPTLEYSVNNGEWTELGTNVVTFGGVNGDMRLRGKSAYGTADISKADIGVAGNISVYPEPSFVFGDNSILVECKGDIRTLIDYENYKTTGTDIACFAFLFRGTPIVSAPELPSTIIAPYCYYCMFEDCTQLLSAPELPATVLDKFCYYSMFSGCESLTSAPSLPATTLVSHCYDSMFQGCASLTAAPSLPATTLVSGCYFRKFLGCTSLTSAPSLPATTLANECYAFMFDGCKSLTAAPSLPATTLASSCYVYMFDGCKSLTAAPSLPATTLAISCYYSMFSDCTSLTAAPSLPATTLEDWCYCSMFSDCTSLTSAPLLPATTLTEGCYESMFQGCTSLTAASSLPATTLASSCCRSMFSGCESLTAAPSLPATTLVSHCYDSMFRGCTSLTAAPSLPATTLAEECYWGMFSGCTSLTTAPSLPATTLARACYGVMFDGYCNKLSYVKMMATDISAYDCLYNWLNGVASTGTFVKNSAATWDETGIVPEGWTVLTADE